MKALILGSGTEISDEQENAGEVGGESGRDSLEVVVKSKASSFGSALNCNLLLSFHRL